MSEVKTGLDDFLVNGSVEEFKELPIEKGPVGPHFSRDEKNGDVLWIGVSKEGEMQTPQFICSSLDIKARTRNEKGVDWGRLLFWKDQDKTLHQWPMPMELCKGSGEEIRGELLRGGLIIGVTTRAPQKLIEYIQTTNPKDNAKALCTGRTGWHSNCFVLPDRTIGDTNGEIIIYQSSSSQANTMGQHGELQQWRDNVAALCIGNSRLVLAVSMSFAPALLNITHDESGGINIVGGSSTGKTTAGDAASSVYGSPEEYTKHWRATINGLEGMAALHNDQLLPLDELAQVDANEIGRIAYMLSNGQGKGRSSQTGVLRSPAKWRLLFLSTGEIGIAEHIRQAGKKSKAGQEVRLVDLPADAGCRMGLFENIHGMETPANFADTIKQRTRQYYGTAFPAFLENLMLRLPTVSNELNQLRSTFISTYLPIGANGQITRVTRRFSLIAAAGELATDMGITGWEEGTAFREVGTCFKAWLDTWGGTDCKENQLMIQDVRRFFEAHGESRFSDMKNNQNNNGRDTINRAGFRELNKDGVYEYYVLRETFKEICSGHDIKLATKCLVERGIIEPDSAGKNQKAKRLPNMGQQRCYHFTSKIWSYEE